MEGNKNNSDIKIINDKDKTLNEIGKKKITNVLPPQEIKNESKNISENNTVNINGFKINENKDNNLINENKNLNSQENKIISQDKNNKMEIEDDNNNNKDNKETNNKETNNTENNNKESNKDNNNKDNNNKDIKDNKTENNKTDNNKENNNKNENAQKDNNNNKDNKNINNTDEQNRITNTNEKSNNIVSSIIKNEIVQPKENIIKEKYRARLSSIKKTACRNVNNYKIIEDHIGEGTFGMVFKAEYVGNIDYAEKMGIPKYVALKKIKMEDSKEGFPITALREIMIMKKCNHENLLQILEIVTSKSLIKNQKKQNVYLVFEYMEHDLSGLALAKYSFDLPQIKYIMYQILKGVQYLHKNNIIHRDIKCANILINNKGKVKIGDFGLARNITPNHTKKYTYKVVTLWFRAPELLFGETLYGTAIDIWSCGCVFGELLTGNCPFQGKDEESLMTKICEKCGTPNETNWPGVTKLPFYNKLCPRTIFPNSFVEHFKNFPKIDEVAMDLFSKMLQLDPKKRITIDEALNHPFFTDHKPSMCTAKEMPRLDKDYHEYEYSRHHKKMKEQNQNIAKKDYLNKQNNNNNQYFQNKILNNNNQNNKDYHNNNFLGKKHYLEKNNYNYNKNNDDGWQKFKK